MAIKAGGPPPMTDDEIDELILARVTEGPVSTTQLVLDMRNAETGIGDVRARASLGRLWDRGKVERVSGRAHQAVHLEDVEVKANGLYWATRDYVAAMPDPVLHPPHRPDPDVTSDTDT